MIGTTRATKNFTTSPQEQKFKTDNTQYMSTEEQKKALGDKELGQVLNEISDPNYVEPSKIRKVGNSNLDKDAFFKLMLAQIKAQSPLQPMESHEMAAHLAQFTSLEQLYNVNENLAGLKKGQDPMANYQMVGFIGKSVVADSSQLIRSKGDTSHDIRFTLPTEAQSADISILDSTGKEVRRLHVANLKKGENKISWNGVLDDGSSARAGEYNLSFSAKDSSEKKVEVQTKFSGRVTGVNYTSQGPVLMMGDQTIKLSDVKRIEDETMKGTQSIDQAHVATAKSAAIPQEAKQGPLDPKATTAVATAAATLAATTQKPEDDSNAKAFAKPAEPELRDNLDQVSTKGTGISPKSSTHAPRVAGR